MGTTQMANGLKVRVVLPEGAVGILFLFKTKKAAREFWGKDIELLEVEAKGGE